jgi:hypothetical protein
MTTPPSGPGTDDLRMRSRDLPTKVEMSCSTMSGYCCSGVAVAGLAHLARHLRLRVSQRRQVAELRRWLEGGGTTLPPR